MGLFKTIYLIGMVQGFFLLLALLVKNYGKRQQNYYFLSLIGLVSLALLGRFGYSQEAYLAFPQIWYLLDSVALLIGPLWYLSLLKSIQPKVKLSKQDILFASPLLLQFIFILYLFLIGREKVLAQTQASWFKNSFYVFCLGVLIVNLYSINQSQRLIQKYRDSQFPPLLVMGQFAFLGILLVWLLSFVVSFLWTHVYQINLSAYIFAFLSMAFLTFALAFMALVKPSSFYFLTQVFDSSETFVLQQIADQVENYLKEEEPYLDSSFSLNDLSSNIQSNPVLTSKAINRILKTTFNDMMNSYRVKHFLRLMKEEGRGKYTLWGVAQEAGFGNKVTFYKSFKKVMGTTPKVYLSSHP